MSTATIVLDDSDEIVRLSDSSGAEIELPPFMEALSLRCLTLEILKDKPEPVVVWVGGERATIPGIGSEDPMVVVRIKDRFTGESLAIERANTSDFVAALRHVLAEVGVFPSDDASDTSA